MPPSIKLQNIGLNYHEHWLFQNLSVTFPAGQWSALLGPSGVGKSSLLRLIAGLKTGGELSKEASITADNQTPLSKQIAYLSQHDSLMPWLSTLENVLLGYRLRGRGAKEKKQQAIDLLKHVGLGKAINKRPSALSGGMKQRAALVRTLLEDKPIVLMDEPFSALDVISKLKLQELAYELLQNKTVLLVTHDPLEALRLCDKVFVMQSNPATLQEAVIPHGVAPRDPQDAELLKQQGHLLIQLKNAYEACA
jgi:putative hydroxymethylpyrimidine transport system ATP-binding protein